MSLRVICLCVLALVTTACSNGGKPSASALPGAPSPIAGVIASPAAGLVSGAMDVTFPARTDTADFRNQLETKYQTGLRRAASATFVDREGEVVWIPEYLRYRVNGCDHATATQRVLAQIDGNPPGPVCGPSSDGAVPFPPRDQTIDFRRQLEGKYQQMNRSTVSSFVDPEGSSIWIQEYNWYRTNACDHTTSVQKVFSQIDGGGVAPVCFVPCAYRVGLLAQEIPAAGGLFSTTLHALSQGSGTCAWRVSTSTPWIRLRGDTSGQGFGYVEFTADPNPSATRTGVIRFDWTGGAASHEVIQLSSPYTVLFEMFDTLRSTSATTDCDIRSTATPCTFTANADLPGNQTFNWRVSYTYGIDKTVTQSSTSNTFVLTEGCGGAGASAEGHTVDINVEMTVRDDRGNESTVRSGQASQPSLRLKVFSC